MKQTDKKQTLKKKEDYEFDPPKPCEKHSDCGTARPGFYFVCDDGKCLEIPYS